MKSQTLSVDSSKSSFKFKSGYLKNEKVKSKLSKNPHILTASMMANVNLLESNQVDFINFLNSLNQ